MKSSFDKDSVVRECLRRQTAHDLKNMFSVILGNIDLLQEQCGDEEALRCLLRIEQACQRGVGLIDAIGRCEETDHPLLR